LPFPLPFTDALVLVTALAGSVVTDGGCCTVTVTEMSRETVPDRAVTVVFPAARAVMSPELTEAIVLLPVNHSTVLAVNELPVLSFGVAVTWVICPTPRFTDVVLNSIDATSTGVTVTPSLHDPNETTPTSRMIVPAPRTRRFII
jgi:hypothetical protein